MYLIYSWRPEKPRHSLLDFARSREGQKFPEVQKMKNQVEVPKVTNLPRDNLERG